jgi:hypothetical protein
MPVKQADVLEASSRFSAVREVARIDAPEASSFLSARCGVRFDPIRDSDPWLASAQERRLCDIRKMLPLMGCWLSMCP